MKIAIASDHRGVQVKKQVINLLTQLNHEVVDYGPDEEAESVDYPDFAFKVGQAVSNHEVDRGVLICGTGLGMCIAANKIRGVRATNCHDDMTAKMSRLHNDANVMCMSADLLGERVVEKMVEIWMTTEFEGGRHARRVEKIAEMECQPAPLARDEQAQAS